MGWPPIIRDLVIVIAVWTAVLWTVRFIAWLISDTIGPHWLHTLSLPAALIFIAVGAVLSGDAGWVGGP